MPLFVNSVKRSSACSDVQEKVQSTHPSATSNGDLGTTPTVRSGRMNPPPPLAMSTAKRWFPNDRTSSIPG